MKAKHEGFVKLTDLGDGKWRAAWWDSETRRYMRRVVPATSLREAREVARTYNSEILEKRGYIPSIRGRAGHSVKTALGEAIGASRGRNGTKAHYALLANQFLDWLEARFPGVTQWRDVKPLHLQEYIRWSEEKGAAFDTIRLRLVPVKMAARYMADNFPESCRDISRRVRLPKRAKREPSAVPDGDEVGIFLSYLAARRPDIFPIALLQALAGLRVLEALSIREQDVDFEAGTVTIAETPIHIPKTPESCPTIPVYAPILEALRTATGARKVIHDRGFLFLTRYGRPWTRNGYGDAVRRMFRQCGRDKGIESLRSLRPRELRAAFATLARTLGADSRVVQAYLGQAPSDILGRSYERMTLERLRGEVVDHLDQFFEGKIPSEGVSDLSQTYIGRSGGAAKEVDVKRLTG
ncbi:MAG TPA: tyrosine-type recombinase/integrase [Sumerlaeia bacterium]|nr:tyrosine-type recombinase/integrase [Sumerlaeia bacterium]